MSAAVDTPAQANPGRGPYRDYSPEFKAETLAILKSNDNNILRTANECGIAETTLRSWIESEDRYHEIRDRKPIDLASRIESNAYKLADSIAVHDLENATLQAKATAMGIMVDKMQILRGLPTDITLNVTRIELADRLSDTLQDVIDVTPES